MDSRERTPPHHDCQSGAKESQHRCDRRIPREPRHQCEALHRLSKVAFWLPARASMTSGALLGLGKKTSELTCQDHQSPSKGPRQQGQIHSQVRHTFPALQPRKLDFYLQSKRRAGLADSEGLRTLERG